MPGDSQKFGSILFTGQEKGSGKLYYSKPHLVYMHCSYAMLTNAERQHATAVQTYKSRQIQSVMTVLGIHRVCALWNSSCCCYNNGIPLEHEVYVHMQFACYVLCNSFVVSIHHVDEWLDLLQKMVQFNQIVMTRWIHKNIFMRYLSCQRSSMY